MSVSFVERCNGHVGGVSTLRGDLTFIVSVGLRKY